MTEPETWISAEGLRVYQMMCPDKGEWWQAQCQSQADTSRGEIFDREAAKQLGDAYAAPILKSTDRGLLPYHIADYERLIDQTDHKAAKAAKANAWDNLRASSIEFEDWVKRASAIRAVYVGAENG